MAVDRRQSHAWCGDFDGPLEVLDNAEQPFWLAGVGGSKRGLMGMRDSVTIVASHIPINPLAAWNDNQPAVCCCQSSCPKGKDSMPHGCIFPVIPCRLALVMLSQ